ncbi:MAG: glycosyltransferase [Chloroflexi bacterium]|nr:glycosyltransferase [Chloroflexota bacterium]
MASPRVSVLLPCYNAAETLDEALDSLARQTLDDFEIVAVDDGSSDATPEILRAWQRRQPRLVCIECPHEGLIAALNAGLQVCRAEWTARMDADDRAHPARLEKQAAFLAEHPEIAAVACRVSGFPAEALREGFQIYMEWQNSLLTDEDIRREMFVESPLAHPSVMFRRSAVLAAGGYQEHGWAEDYDLWLRLYLQGAGFAKLPEVLLEWRERPDRLTRCDGRYSLENFLRAKAHYLAQWPLLGREVVFIWGAGMAGRRLSKHLLRQGVPLEAFFDIDPRKLGGTRRGLPVLPPEDLPARWAAGKNPALLAAVGARRARPIVRSRLEGFGLREGLDWWSVA